MSRENPRPMIVRKTARGPVPDFEAQNAADRDFPIYDVRVLRRAECAPNLSIMTRAELVGIEAAYRLEAILCFHNVARADMAQARDVKLTEWQPEWAGNAARARATAHAARVRRKLHFPK